MKVISICLLCFLIVSCNHHTNDKSGNASDSSKVKKDKSMDEANKELIELMFFGLDHGIESIKDGEGPLIPFSITSTNGERKLDRFVTENLEDGLVKAVQYIKDLEKKPNFAIVVYDGYITMEGKKFDAILVKGYDKNDVLAYILAQRYLPKQDTSDFKLIGNTAFLGNDKNILNE
jgi:hypothetical protein